ncbi:MAG: hypoxanthine phosphoribosyltransferase [Cellvibrionales bacterium]|nr:hypoxanthine phosphoribosyltransferase [Cellvibrionales bacterium]
MATHPDIERVFYSKEVIAKRVEELGAIISKDYADISEPLIVVTLMKGAVMFSSDLVRSMTCPVLLDYMIVGSYGSATVSSKEVRIIKDLQTAIDSHHLLILDDIIDTGFTLEKVTKILQERNPKSIKICTLLDKKARREVDINVDYSGFDVADEFVVGYGLDYAGLYRNLPYVGILKPLNDEE